MEQQSAKNESGLLRHRLKRLPGQLRARLKAAFAQEQPRAHPEERWARKEFALLRHHLANLPDRSRTRLQSAFARELVDEKSAHATLAHPDARWLRKEFGLLLHHLATLPERSRVRLQGAFAQELVEQTCTVDTPAGRLSFVLLGRTAAGRAMTMLTKQPATIRWIDSFARNSVFWDVGANVGVYALYAALREDMRVVAFEPAAVNYFLLTANCEVNHFDSRIDCLLLGLGNAREITRLEVSQFSSAKSFSFRGTRHHQQFQGTQAAIILSMDRLIEEYGVACPNYIKIDTPGMTESILAGGARTLQREEVRELHIELREHSKRGQHIIEMLRQTGFVIAGRDTHGASADLTFARPGRRSA